MNTDLPPDEEVIERETLLEFPCKFPVKAMGLNDPGFQALVERIILADADIHPDQPVTTNLSKSEKYLSVTVTIDARSKQQLDTIYHALTDCPQVKIAL